MTAAQFYQRSFFVVFIFLFAQGCGTQGLPFSPTPGSVFEEELQNAPYSPATDVAPLSVGPLFTELPASIKFEKLYTYHESARVQEQLVQFHPEPFEKFLAQSTPQMKTKLALHLFDDLGFEVLVERAEKDVTGVFIVSGKVWDDPQSRVVLILNQDSLVAQISAPATGEQLEIRPLGQGAHIIRRSDVSESAESDVVITPEAPSAAEQGSQQPESLNDIKQDFPVIDILVAYTPNARIQQGGTDGIQALIHRGIADTNRAFEDSGARVRVRLVGTYETRQNETSSLYTDLHSLQRRSDGFWDDVLRERERVRADQVSVVGVYSRANSLGGIGFFNSRFDSAYTILKTASFRHYTMAHELGHNLGLNHSDGYKSRRGRFGTIMAYGAPRRICRFSNPALTYKGHPTGDRRHNETRILDKNAARVAAFM